MADEEQLGEALEEGELEYEIAELSPYSKSDVEIEEIEEENLEESTLFSHLGESSDNEEKQRRYKEYLELIKQIDCQNRIINDFKVQIMTLCNKPCKTRCEIKEIKRLRLCMEEENMKLNCMINKAMNLQNFGSRRRWGDLPLATTMDEDNMAPYTSCIPMQITQWKGGSSETQESESQSLDSAEERNLQKLYKVVARLNICDPGDQKLIREIEAALKCKKKKKEDPCAQRKAKREPCPSPCMHAQRKSKPCDRREDSPCQDRRKASPCTKRKAESPCPDPMEQLKQKIAKMQCTVDKLKKEIAKRAKAQPCEQETAFDESEEPEEEESDSIVCGKKKKTTSDKMAELKQTYLHLLSQYRKKDCQLKELEKRMKATCDPCGGGKKIEGPDPEAELELFRSRLSDLKEEQIEFKCIMKEQSKQLEDYRDKYLAAQQRVEEQCVALDKLNMNNKRMEDQINNEINEIRAKFQERLNELLHLPKMLEDEQMKLAQCCKDKEELQGQLSLICKELKAAKAQLEALKENPDCRPLLAQCQLELSKVKEQLEQCIRQRELLCEQVKITQDDLDTLRSESAKIIARTKERAEMIRQQHLQQIDCLEKELAQCRATACLSVKDREAVIREMQGQLNTLSYSFDSAQKQIKTLRNHIDYMSNENNCPAKC